MKVIPILWAAAVAGSGCAFSAKMGGGSTGGGPGSGAVSAPASGASRRAAMPDLSGKTPAEARAALEAAGFAVVSGEENVDDLCGEGEDHAMTRQGGICKQTPMAGVEVEAGSVRLRYTIEHDAYDHGGDAGGNPWRRMPDVVGKPLGEADRVLASAQLGVARHFEIVDAGDACAAEVVCDQYPRARERMFVKRPGRLYVGSAHAAPPPSAAAPPAPAPPPAPASQPTAKPDTYF